MRLGRTLATLLFLLPITTACDEPPRPVAGLTGGWGTAGCALALPRPSAPPGLTDAMTRIDRGAGHGYPGVYAGIEIEQNNVRAVVYRVPSAPFDDFVRAEARDACVVVRDAAHSRADLLRWSDRVLADLEYWRSRGVPVVSVGSRRDGAGVEIGVRDAATARRELRARYGATAPLIFVEEGPVPAGPAPPVAAQPGG